MKKILVTPTLVTKSPPHQFGCREFRKELYSYGFGRLLRLKILGGGRSRSQSEIVNAVHNFQRACQVLSEYWSYALISSPYKKLDFFPFCLQMRLYILSRTSQIRQNYDFTKS